MNTKIPTATKATGQERGSQMRITPEEIAIIKRTFKDNTSLVRLMRKLFLPELDPKAPIGQMVDLWMTLKIDELSPEEAMVNLKARNLLITHVDQQLMSIELIANMPDENPEEVSARIKSNSSK